MVRIPAYRKHKPSGRAVFCCRRLFGDDRMVYLPGRYGSPESKAEYGRLVAELLAKESIDPAAEARKRRQPRRRATLNELCLAFLDWALENHGGKHGREYRHYVCAVTVLREHYGESNLEDFGPVKLEHLQRAMIDCGWSRRYINAQIARIVRMFRKAVAWEWCAASTWQELKALEPLKPGRSTARETEEVQPVDWEHVAAVLPHCWPQLAAMIQVHWLTGMRSDELTAMRGADITQRPDVWLYSPQRHKTQYRGKAKVIPLGPRARELLKPYLPKNPEDYVFSPARSFIEIGRKPTRAMQKRYAAASYNHAIKHAFLRLAKANHAAGKAADQPEPTGYPKSIPAAIWLAKYGVHYWHPHQLRHSRATLARQSHRVEGAQALLGNTIQATQIYAEQSLELAISIANEHG